LLPSSLQLDDIDAAIIQHDVHIYLPPAAAAAAVLPLLGCCLWPNVMPAVELLLPLFFASSGIKTDIGALNTARYWGIAAAIIAMACFAKLTPTTLLTKVHRYFLSRHCLPEQKQPWVIHLCSDTVCSTHRCISQTIVRSLSICTYCTCALSKCSQ